jgi:RNA polymerase sigma-70 factor (family 1)
MGNLLNEKKWLQLIAEGDSEAFSHIFNQYWDQVYGTALRLTKSPEQSKDLAQDIFLKMWDQRERLADVNNFPAFLYTISKNLVHDYLRKQVFRSSNKEFLENYFSLLQTAPDDRLEQLEAQHIFLYQAISKLPPTLKKVIQLSRFDGLSHEEIASKMQITPLSSKTYMVRALVALRKQLAKQQINLSLFACLILRQINF